MTYKNLLDAVARLGFERELEDEGALRPALSRALVTIFTERQEEKRARIAVPRYDGRLLISEIEHQAGGCEVYPLSGKAFSMMLSGKGSYTVRTATATYTESFSGELVPVRKILAGEGEIAFLGDYAYTVLSLAVYPTLRSPNPLDIPLFGEIGVIDLKRAIPDLLSVAGAPRDCLGREISGASVNGSTLILPCGYHGETVITYYRTPRLPSGLDPSEEIDLPKECEELLPLLVAAYVWLEDSPEKSELYLSLYREGMATLHSFISRRGVGEYRTNGWA